MLARSGAQTSVIRTTDTVQKTPGITVGRLVGAHPEVMKKVTAVKKEIQTHTGLPRSLNIFDGRLIQSSHTITCADIETLKTQTTEAVQDNIDWLQIYYKQLAVFQKAIEGMASPRDIEKELTNPKYTHITYVDTTILNRVIGQLPSLSFVEGLLNIPAFAGVKFSGVTLKKLLEKVHNISHIQMLFDLPQVQEMSFDTETLNFLYKQAKSVDELDAIIAGVRPRKRKQKPQDALASWNSDDTVKYNAQTVLQIVEVVVKDPLYPVEHKQQRIIETFATVDPESDFEWLDRGMILKQLFELTHIRGIKWEDWFYTKLKKTPLWKVLDDQIAIGKNRK